ncbi:sterile alpha motif domain-containing protein 12-like [Rhineura floridana]|uniref:sterile alpha motif domain-containing protein 12-like n=1 Tax=Rhineura floridana TaxID=261503 RepID=UPI002AC88895|nr:sterile alpha motif domain-containing protein 12-like [Rhineura floridana]
MQPVRIGCPVWALYNRKHKNICHIDFCRQNISEPSWTFACSKSHACPTAPDACFLHPTVLMDSHLENGLGALNGVEDQLRIPAGSETGSEEGEAKRPVALWTVAEVCSWLSSGAWGRPLLQAANSHAISGKVLLRLTDETLERMGVAPWSLRQELLHQVLRLRIQQEMEDLLDITDE